MNYRFKIFFQFIIISISCFNIHGQNTYVQADMAVGNPYFTDLNNFNVSANALVSNQIYKMQIPFFNNGPNQIPNRSINLRINLGNRIVLNNDINYIFANSPLNNYFIWTFIVNGLNTEINGRQIAQIPAGTSFPNIEFQVLVGSNLGSGNVLLNTLIPNLNNDNPVVLLDELNSANNFTSLSYTSIATIVPANSIFEINCLDQANPIPPILNSACGSISSSSNTFTISPQTNFCNGQKVYYFYYIACDGQTLTWKATYNINRNAAPSLPLDQIQNIDCINDAIPPSVPIITDQCGIMLSPELTISTIYLPESCSGNRIYRYKFTDCAGFNSTWQFTYQVHRNTPPVIAITNQSSNIICLDLAIPPQVPIVIDACGNTINPTESIADNMSNCVGTRIYSYVFTDCAGLTSIWQYTYNIDGTDIDLVVPANKSVDACQSQNTIDNLYFNWLNDLSSTGGCDIRLSNNSISTPSSCGEVKTVMFTATSICGFSVNKSAIFTVESPTVAVINIENQTEASCQTQSIIDSKYAVWLASVTSLGGCNIQIINNSSETPNYCGGSKTVIFTATDCNNTVVIKEATFTVSEPSLVVLNIENQTEASCQTQSIINTKYATWLASVTNTGGCNVLITNNSTENPSYCGGIKTVIFSATDCNNTLVTKQATFTVSEPPLIVLIIENQIEASCQTQAIIDSKYTAWLAMVTNTGGCNVQITNNSTESPSYCGDTKIVIFTATDCNNAVVTKEAIFTVSPVLAPNVLPDFTSEINCNSTISAPITSDPCFGNITATTLDNTLFTELGNYTINWVFTNECNKSSLSTQSIKVIGIHSVDVNIILEGSNYSSSVTATMFKNGQIFETKTTNNGLLSFSNVCDGSFTVQLNQNAIPNFDFLAESINSTTDPNVDGIINFNILNNQVNLAKTSATSQIKFEVKPKTNPLPISLEKFEVKKDFFGNLLSWKVSNSVNFSEFVIEKSSDALNFSAISGIEFNPEKFDYGFQDNLQTQNIINYYRLKLIDNDGSFKYSKILSVTNNQNESIYLGELKPNPVSQNETYISIFTDNDEDIKIEILNQLGNIIESKKKQIYKGENKLKIEINNSIKSINLIKIYIGNQIFTRKILN